MEYDRKMLWSSGKVLIGALHLSSSMRDESVPDEDNPDIFIGRGEWL
jgi:hypothetical protein